MNEPLVMSEFLTLEIKEVYRRVAAREKGHEHGDFLTAFAEAVIRADAENFEVLRPAARLLIQKYGLIQEFTPPWPPLDTLPDDTPKGESVADTPGDHGKAMRLEPDHAQLATQSAKPARAPAVIGDLFSNAGTLPPK